MLKKSSAVYLIAILSALMVTPAQARPQTFVASYGNDANPCGRVLPCRQFDQGDERDRSQRRSRGARFCQLSCRSRSPSQSR